MSETKTADAALARVEKTVVALDEYGAATPKTLDEQLHFCKWAVESRIVPVKTVAEAFVVMQRGGELGFRGLASFDFLYPVNGRVRITPAGCKGKALASGLLVDQREEEVVDKATGAPVEAIVTVLRKGIPTPFVGRFSVSDAKTARLWGKDNWDKYPRRMLLARARGFAYGDAFTDLVGGLQVREKFDLDPDDRLGLEPAAPSEPRPAPSTPDPLLAGAVPAPVIDVPATVVEGAPCCGKPHLPSEPCP
jgi:hypothetical protein